MATVAAEELAGLSSRLQGEAIGRADDRYDEARAVYNAMIDKRPEVIVRCDGVADVIAGMGFARERGLTLAVRSGGHNGAGLGTVDGGLVLDLAPMSTVTVDPETRTAVVGGGAQLGAVDRATHEHGLAVPAGIISTTGVGGLTLGGGVGHLSRGCGLTIDNLLAAEMVLADGSVVHVRRRPRAPTCSGRSAAVAATSGSSPRSRSGVIPSRPSWRGPCSTRSTTRPRCSRWYRDFIREAPEELGGFFAFLTVPPGPPFPEELHMRKVCGVVWCSTNDDPDAPALKAARSFGTPLLDGIAPVPLPAWQSAFDGLYPAGDQWYWRADFVGSIPDAAIEEHARFGEALPTWKSTMHLYPIGGAPSRVGETETAWAYRDANWAQVMVGVDPDPANADLIREWTISYWEALHPHSLGGAYVNFMMEEGQERVQATYRGNYDRLARTKAHYDPDNVFRVNQNIRPV